MRLQLEYLAIAEFGPGGFEGDVAVGDGPDGFFEEVEEVVRLGVVAGAEDEGAQASFSCLKR